MSAPDIRSGVHQAVTGVWGNVKQRHQDLERRVSVTYPLTPRTVLLPSAFRKWRSPGCSTRPDAAAPRCPTLGRSARGRRGATRSRLAGCRLAIVQSVMVKPDDSCAGLESRIHRRLRKRVGEQEAAGARSRRCLRSGLTGAEASHRDRCWHHTCTRCRRSVRDVERLARRQICVYCVGARP